MPALPVLGVLGAGAALIGGLIATSPKSQDSNSTAVKSYAANPNINTVDPNSSSAPLATSTQAATIDNSSADLQQRRRMAQAQDLSLFDIGQSSSSKSLNTNLFGN